MAVTSSQSVERGTPLPGFSLAIANPDVDSIRRVTRSVEDYRGARVLVLVFTCNHCPYAKHVEDALIEFAHDFEEQGVQVVAVCSNDATTYPDDSFSAMSERAAAKGFPFPYLHDATQELARACDARCTPDFFVYGPERTLQYHGRMDASRPGQGAATGDELRRAVRQLLDAGRVHGPQEPSIGCSIKWKPGMAPGS